MIALIYICFHIICAGINIAVIRYKDEFRWDDPSGLYAISVAGGPFFMLGMFTFMVVMWILDFAKNEKNGG